MKVIYSDFYKKITESIEDEGLASPLKIEISLTNGCNQNCQHCSNAYRINKDVKFIEERLIYDAILCNPLVIVLTGGEPLLHPKFISIVKEIKKHNIYIRLLTNGTLITDKLISDLFDAGWTGNDIIQISLDSVDENLYYNQRGTNDCHKVLHSIKKCVEAGITVDVHTVPTGINLFNIYDIYKTISKFKVAFFSGAALAPIRADLLDLMCPQEELLKIHERILLESSSQATKYIGGIDGMPCANPDVLDKYLFMKKERKLIYKCSAGRYSCYINESGKVFPCVFLLDKRACCGDLHDNRLIDIWNNTTMYDYKIGFSIKNTFCENCKYWGLCNGGCIGVSATYSEKIKPGNDIRCYRHQLKK